jgi:hypothetical protein
MNVKIIIAECEDNNCWMWRCTPMTILSMFPSRSALIVSLQKLNESNNYEPIIVTLKWFYFNSGYLGIIRHWCTSSHSAIIIFTFSNYYLTNINLNIIVQYLLYWFINVINVTLVHCLYLLQHNMLWYWPDIIELVTLTSSHSAITIFTFNNYYLHNQ